LFWERRLVLAGKATDGKQNAELNMGQARVTDRI
jgi:hypothetical protein